MRPRTQSEVYKWVVESFGTTAKNRWERAARLIEEALEVGQAEGLTIAQVAAIGNRIYEGDPGETRRELGGVMLTLQAMAESASVDLEDAADEEWARVLSKTQDWWDERHGTKIAAGTADLPPPGGGT